MSEPENLEPKDIQSYLTDVDYPATGEQLVDVAKQHGAPDRVVTFLERIPADSHFESKSELMDNLPADMAEGAGDMRDSDEMEDSGSDT